MSKLKTKADWLAEIGQKTGADPILFSYFGSKEMQYEKGLIGFFLNHQNQVIPVYHETLIIWDKIEIDGMNYETAVDDYGYNTQSYSYVDLDKTEPMIVSQYGDFVEAHITDKDLIGQVESFNQDKVYGVYKIKGNKIPFDQEFDDRIYVYLFEDSVKDVDQALDEYLNDARDYEIKRLKDMNTTT